MVRVDNRLHTVHSQAVPVRVRVPVQVCSAKIGKNNFISAVVFISIGSHHTR